jgi:Putative transposase
LLETAADPSPRGASIGFLAVLHTWGQNRHLHPQLHCIVSAGGMSLDGSRWLACRKSLIFFCPCVCSVVASESLSCGRRAFRKGALHFSGQLESLWQPVAFRALCGKAAATDWVAA